MRKWNLPQVNTKVMCAVLAAAMVMTGFTACGGTSSASTASSESATEEKETLAPESTTEQSTTEQSVEAAKENEEKVESYLGQITAIDGNVISIALAEKPEAPAGEVPDGEAPGDKVPKDSGGAPSGEKSGGEATNGEKPTGDRPAGETPADRKPEKDMLDDMTLTLSGDTMTITVNDDTIITIDGKDATLDDLQVGDTVSFFLDGEIVTSLSVGMPEKTEPMPEESMQAPEQK